MLYSLAVDSRSFRIIPLRPFLAFVSFFPTLLTHLAARCLYVFALLFSSFCRLIGLSFALIRKTLIHDWIGMETRGLYDNIFRVIVDKLIGRSLILKLDTG